VAWIRRGKPTKKHPQGLWRATVYTPAGRRTMSHEFKGAVKKWADDQERAVDDGDWIDPKLGDLTVAKFWERAKDGRGHRETASRRRDESHWRNHVEPKWGQRRLGSILKPDINAWVKEMQSAHRGDCTRPANCKGCKVGTPTIHGAVHVLRSLLEAAVDARMIRFNPARGVRLPPLPVQVDRLFTADEERVFLARLDERFPGRVDARPFVELLFDSGVRWEEAAAISRDVWDLRKGRFQVAAVMEADGTIRRYGKRDASNRWCAVSPELLARLRPVVMATPAGGLVFTAPGKAHAGDCRNRKRCAGCKQSQLVYSNWLRRVWKAALTVEVPAEPAPRRKGTPGPAPKAVRRVPLLDDPQPTPHDARHTYGTRLADEGIPQHDIAALMGHADERSTRRYIHAGDERFARAEAALRRARAAGNSPATHDLGGRSETAGS